MRDNREHYMCRWGAIDRLAELCDRHDGPQGGTMSDDRLSPERINERIVRALHYYGNPPDPRLQGRVDGDVQDILDDVRTLGAENARLATTVVQLREKALAYLDANERQEQTAAANLRLEAENARLALIVEQSRDLNQELYDRAEGLAATVAQLRAAGVRLRDIWGRQSKHHYTDRDLVAAVHDIAVALEETTPKEEP